MSLKKTIKEKENVISEKEKDIESLIQKHREEIIHKTHEF